MEAPMTLRGRQFMRNPKKESPSESANPRTCVYSRYAGLESRAQTRFLPMASLVGQWLSAPVDLVDAERSSAC